MILSQFFIGSLYFKTTHRHLRPARSQYARFITGGKVSRTPKEPYTNRASREPRRDFRSTVVIMPLSALSQLTTLLPGQNKRMQMAYVRKMMPT